jgi:hypothetical protein
VSIYEDQKEMIKYDEISEQLFLKELILVIIVSYSKEIMDIQTITVENYFILL